MKVCSYIDENGCLCSSPSKWYLYIGNGDKAADTCGKHLNKVMDKVYAERAVRVTGREIIVGRRSE